MGWNKDGSTVKAMYLSEYPVTGIVTESRVKYGGAVQYTIALTEPLQLPWRGVMVGDGPRNVVMVNENQITADFGVIETV